jgi:hypothetical protein
MGMQQIQLARGDFVQVRSFEEIRRTMDSDMSSGGLPFMPEMLPFCGNRMKVLNRADHIEVDSVGMRRMQDAVLLEGARCNGLHHGDCQRGCMFLWRSAWLRPVIKSCDDATKDSDETLHDSHDWLTSRNGRYFCQCTQLPCITIPLHFLDFRQYVRNVYWGILAPDEQIKILGRHLINKIRYSRGPKSPQGKLNVNESRNTRLAPGDWVEVKGIQEIERTLNPSFKNRGLRFMKEMRQYCGRRCQVESRIDRIINDANGMMVAMKDTVTLKNVHCDGSCHYGCPRRSLLFWREEWLQKIPDYDPVGQSASSPLPEDCISHKPSVAKFLNKAFSIFACLLLLFRMKRY